MPRFLNIDTSRFDNRPYNQRNDSNNTSNRWTSKERPDPEHDNDFVPTGGGHYRNIHTDEIFDSFGDKIDE